VQPCEEGRVVKASHKASADAPPRGRALPHSLPPFLSICMPLEAVVIDGAVSLWRSFALLLTSWIRRLA